MARKRDAIQIQTDVTTQEEWEQEIAKPGLTVVDVYPDWCGPCISMLGTLKKIKFELGDDMLNYVTARADDIAALEEYRNRCEPLWLFFGSGQPVLQMRGAHSPLLTKKIIEELENEKKVIAGERERATIQLECDAPAAVQLPPEVAAPEDEEETAAALNARRQRSELRVRKALAAYSLLVIGPAAADRRDEILPLLESRGFTVGVEMQKTLTEEQVDALLTPPPIPAAEQTAADSAPEAAAGEGDGASGAAEEDAEGTIDADAEAAGEEAEDTGGAEGAEDTGGAGGAEEDPEVVARRQVVKEKLLEGECALLALKDSDYSEQNPYRFLTLYLGRAPAPPPGVSTETEVPPPADGEQHGSESDGAETSPAEVPEVVPEDGAAAEEPEPPVCGQLQELLGEEATGAVFSPETVAGQWAALRLHFPQLYRAPEPAPAAPPAGRQVAFVVFAGEREQAAQQLTEAGFTVLHSGVDQLTEEVAGQLVARLEGGESQLPELVAAPVMAAAVASDGGAALSAIANLDPLYLSDSSAQADQDAKLVFASWGVKIGPLQAVADGSEGATEAALEGGAVGAGEEVPEGAAAEEAPAEEPVVADVPAEDAPAEDAPAEDAPAEDVPAEDAPSEDAPAEDAPADEAPAEEAPAAEEAAPATEEAAAVE